MIQSSERAIPTSSAARATCINLSRVVYSLRAVLAAAYKFSDQYAMLVDVDDDNHWTVYIVGSEPVGTEKILEPFIKELADQQLRDELEKQFGDLRTLVVAQAFSEGNLLQPDDKP